LHREAVNDLLDVPRLGVRDPKQYALREASVRQAKRLALSSDLLCTAEGDGL